MKTGYDTLTTDDRKRYDSLVARIERLEEDYNNNRIGLEDYIRQRSLLIAKKELLINKREKERIRYEFVKTIKL